MIQSRAGGVVPSLRVSSTDLLLEAAYPLVTLRVFSIPMAVLGPTPPLARVRSLHKVHTVNTVLEVTTTSATRSHILESLRRPLCPRKWNTRLWDPVQVQHLPRETSSSFLDSCLVIYYTLS